MGEETDLARIASGLAGSLGPGDLDETLDQITAAAVKLVPDVVSASMTVRYGEDRLETLGATDPGLVVLDEAQYSLREGPCYDAATSQAQVVSPDLASDPRFPQYGPAAVRAGVQAQAAFRLFDRGTTQGALNLYSGTKGAFADLDDVAVLFRSQAATAIGYAHEITNLNEALETRTTIGKAMGILMERYQLSDERAFAFLTRLSQHRNIKLRRVADELVRDLSTNVPGAAGVAPGDASA